MKENQCNATFKIKKDKNIITIHMWILVYKRFEVMRCWVRMKTSIQDFGDCGQI